MAWNTQQYVSGRQRQTTPSFQGLTGTMSQRGIGVNQAGGLGTYGNQAAGWGGYPTYGGQQQAPDAVYNQQQAAQQSYRPIAQAMADTGTPVKPTDVPAIPAFPSPQPRQPLPGQPPAGYYPPYRTDPYNTGGQNFGQGGATVMPTITVAKPWAPQGFNMDNAADWARLQQPGSTTTNAQGQIVWAPQAVTKPYEVTSTASGIPRRQTVTPISSTAPFGVRR